MAPKIKRPTYEIQVNTRVPKSISDAIEKLAQNKEIKPSDIVRKAILKYLKEEGVLDKKKKYL